MDLSSALYGATAGVSNASAQISLVSRNIANQSNPNASRKIANVVTAYGLPSMASISQASNSALLTSLLSANSSQAQQSAISSAMGKLESTLGTTAGSTTSPVSLIGQLSDALQTYAVSPQSPISAQAAVMAATNLANGLNSASSTVQSVRADADAGIAGSVAKIKDLLGQFTGVNQSVVAGTLTGSDTTDLVDQRNSLLQQLSGEIGISTVKGTNNDIKIYTDTGLTLFDQTPRQVTFTPTPAFTASTLGNDVYVDGVPVTTVQDSPFKVKSGALAGLVEVRDSLATTYQSQLDQIASGLISAFQETDQSNPSTPSPQAGLFTNGVDLTVPSTATVTQGLAASIQVASSVDISSGTPSLLRDGGISSNGAAPYVYNPKPDEPGKPGETGYSARLNDLVLRLSTPQTFDSHADAGSEASVTDYASASASWLGTKANKASNAASYSAAVQSTASSALSNATGVNLDTELSHMLALEQSYQASAKLMSTVSMLYSALFAAIQ